MNRTETTEVGIRSWLFGISPPSFWSKLFLSKTTYLQVYSRQRTNRTDMSGYDLSPIWFFEFHSLADLKEVNEKFVTLQEYLFVLYLFDLTPKVLERLNGPLYFVAQLFGMKKLLVRSNSSLKHWSIIFELPPNYYIDILFTLFTQPDPTKFQSAKENPPFCYIVY